MFLPRVLIAGRVYWRDDRLQEFRAVHNYQDRMAYSFISPDSDLVHHEPPVTDNETPEMTALRAALLEKAMALQNFGVELALSDGVPEFENDGSNVTSAEELALHMRFWGLQHDYLVALQDVVDAVLEHTADDDEPSR